MRTPTNNNGQPSNDGVADLVRAHLAANVEQAAREAPTVDLRERCRVAALGALDVLRMQEHRPELTASPGSLLEHFQALARLAGVSLDNTFRSLGITCGDAPDVASAHGLAFLARQLGLARDEALLRLRWGFARVVCGASTGEWLPQPLPVRGRHATGAVAKMSGVEEVLHRCEAQYNATRRAELRAALNSFTEAYDQARL